MSLHRCAAFERCSHCVLIGALITLEHRLRILPASQVAQIFKRHSCLQVVCELTSETVPPTTTLVLTFHGGPAPFDGLFSFGTTKVFGETPQLILIILPEPSTGALLGLGLGVLAIGRRLRSRAAPAAIQS